MSQRISRTDDPLDGLEGYAILHDGAGLLDRSDRASIAVAGRDRLSYLHAMLTNDVSALVPGRGCYAAYLTPQGRMIADMRVLELGDLTLLDLEAQVKDQVIERLEAFIFSEDVQLTDLTGTLAEIGVYGPGAARLVATSLWPSGTSHRVPPATAAAELEALSELTSLKTSFLGRSVVVVRSLEIGVPGFDLFVDREAAPGISEALRAGGAVEVGAGAAEATRIEAGRPRFLRDMDSDTIPLEAGIEGRAISFTKGCYPGQEIIIRVVHRGHGRVAKRLVGLRAEGESVPAAGDKVLVEGNEVGRITSATHSPALGIPIALGYVHRDHAGPGTFVTIAHGSESIGATVSPLPFTAATSARSAVPR